MMPRRLEVSVRPDGTITAEASGTPGPDCLDSLDQLRSMLNAQVAESKPTPEFSGATTITRATGHEAIYRHGENHENA
ncbi:DUF2997 domain-containing protein [Microbacterium caowuchunii]|uniref:DUF2997 domain-containing protein n=1 Tax=Microbacterium caowuchunii TaxID=2614638 RepID=UPI001248CB1F|nr:DUF2997 domain-containing protein [Microbacterium caowuchunii]